MCSLYSMTKNQDVIRRLFNIKHDNVGNMPSFPGIFPNNPAHVIHLTNSERALSLMRWGMPNPPGAKYGPYSTNIRNEASPRWRRWLGPTNRCLVPFTSFSEYAPEANPETGKKDVVWFAIDESRPLFAFAGIWAVFGRQRGTKSQPLPGPHNVYAFLTTALNSIVGPVHPKAMPVILQRMLGKHG